MRKTRCSVSKAGILIPSALLITQCALFASADQLSGMKEFQDGQAALAADVNANNLLLSNKAQDLEARILLLENTSNRLVRKDSQSSGRIAREAMRTSTAQTTENGELVELYGGKLILDGVDCTGDPYALNRLYVENSRFSFIQFNIIGDCYGDIARLTLGEPAEAGVYPYLQEHAQVIAIYPAEDPNNPGNSAAARIIPNPDSGKTGLVASFGGALYINSVDIVVGNESIGVLFSRGATGDLHNLTITLPENANSGIRVQHAASPYLGSVTIKGVNAAPSVRGLMLMNNAAVYSYGTLNVSGTTIGIQAVGGASLHSWGTSANITMPVASDTAFWIDSAHVSLGNVETNGQIWVREGGDLNLSGTLTYSGNNIRVDNNGYLHIVPKKANGTTMSGAELDAVLDCNGLATAVIMDSAATDGTASEIANSECFGTSQWETFINSVLDGD